VRTTLSNEEVAATVPGSAAPLLRLAGVGKRFGRGPWVLREVDLSLFPGEVVAVSAANGAGKSTLLRLLVGATRPSAGQIGPRPAGTRYVPDRVAANDRLPALNYLVHMGRLQGLSTRDARRRAIGLLDRLALVGGRRTAIRKLSKGNAQKVALAQAVLTPPRLLVLDEPWSGLDEAAHEVLAEIIAEVAGAGGAVVYTDHREQLTQDVATVRYLLDGGRLSAGPVADRTVMAEVVLFAAAARPPQRAPDWSALPGVVAVQVQPTATLVRVTVDSVDAVLTTALAAGWSIGRFEREDGARWQL
jgi:ABC-type multidrug transport system ATPase subunit